MMIKFALAPDGQVFNKDHIIRVGNLKGGDDSFSFEVHLVTYEYVNVSCSVEKQAASIERNRFVLKLLESNK